MPQPASNIRSANLVGPAHTANLVTVVMGIVVGLTFLFDSIVALALHGGPVEANRVARRLLIFASMVTLSLNVAEPLIAGKYGKAAFEAHRGHQDGRRRVDR